MIDAFDLYKSFQSAVNTFQGGWYRPNTDFIVKCNDISVELWVDWTSKAEKSQEVKDNLRPFFKSKNIIVKTKSNQYGFLTPPEDANGKYGRFASARILVDGQNETAPDKSVDNGQCDGLKSDEERTDEYWNSLSENNVVLVDNQKWAACLKHLTKKPTLDNPKMVQIDGGFNVAPRQVSVIVFDYYVEPEKATFLYTISPGNIQTGAGDQIIYDAKNSTPLQWPDSVRNEFIVRLGEAYNVFTRQEFWAQFSNKQKLEQ